jgi:hypothetical protein
MKMFDAFRLKQQKLLEEQKLANLQQQQLQQKAPITNISVQQTQSGQQIIIQGAAQSVNKFQVQKEPVVIKTQQIQPGSQSTSAIQTPQTISTADIKAELDFLNEDANNSDTDAFKDVLGLSGDLLDNDLVNTIMNEENSKNSVLDDIGNTGEINEALSKNVKDELTDILNSPHFNLVDCKDVEEMFKGVLTDESQESQESVLTNSMTPYSSQSTPSHHSEIMTTPNASSTPQPMQLPQQTPPLQQNQSQPMVSPVHLPMMGNMSAQGQQMGMNQQMMGGQANLPPQNIMSGGTQFTNTFSNQQWSNAPPMETDQLKIMSSGGYTMQPASNPPPTPAPSNYHQKSSERMKEDESKFDDFSIIFLLINFFN